MSGVKVERRHEQYLERSGRRTSPPPNQNGFIATFGMIASLTILKERLTII